MPIEKFIKLYGNHNLILGWINDNLKMQKKLMC